MFLLVLAILAVFYSGYRVYKRCRTEREEMETRKQAHMVLCDMDKEDLGDSDVENLNNEEDQKETFQGGSNVLVYGDGII